MLHRSSHLLDGRPVAARGVALVLSKAVLRQLHIQAVHDPVARHLGNDRSHRYRQERAAMESRIAARVKTILIRGSIRVSGFVLRANESENISALTRENDPLFRKIAFANKIPA